MSKKHHHPLQYEVIALPSKTGAVIVADANTEICTGSSYLTSEAIKMESNGGLAKRRGVKIYKDSPFATMSASERDGTPVSFNAGEKSVLVSMSHTGEVTLTCRGLSSLSVDLPPQVLNPNSIGMFADLDYIIQSMARRILGLGDIECRSGDRAIQGVLRQFRTLFKHWKHHV